MSARLSRFAELRPRGFELLDGAKTSMPNGVPVSWMASLYEHPPIVVRRGNGGAFTDVDGNAYVEFNLADTSMFTGYGVEPIVRAASERMASGPQFLVPTEEAEAVSRELGRRFGRPFWQFTLSSTQANTEAIRVARTVTGRSTVLMSKLLTSALRYVSHPRPPKTYSSHTTPTSRQRPAARK